MIQLIVENHWRRLIRSSIKWFCIDWCFRNQLLLYHPYLVLTKLLSPDIHGQRCGSGKISCKYLYN